ncbi:ParB/RepB/Spo0J family partition protein [Pseudomonas psychrotolerans]|nr:ParB/RepB/Spo0J family partition protein [Pseudomonas psychrotolerans]
MDIIQRGKYQPRRHMDPVALEELANSIRVQGLMQPIVVRAIGEGRYEIIAGERRWRASQQAGLERIPALVRDVPDQVAIALALIENIQRQNLNPLEEAMALQRLQDEFELTQAQVAEAVGKSRSGVTNLLRLLALAEEAKELLAKGELEMGHARALLGLPKARQAERGAARCRTRPDSPSDRGPGAPMAQRSGVQRKGSRGGSRYQPPGAASGRAFGRQRADSPWREGQGPVGDPLYLFGRTSRRTGAHSLTQMAVSIGRNLSGVA